ncbi:DUF4293 family protein [Rubricoccus marinus]|uniref:DUF4293 domain-containing protein n=1 Tax=Rubricoccus marinus TaxID=716817 RepID=A0A259TY34_9BACT|nr:DUF4293 family protein [Rubricoccus marinus]OZC02484.1 hypothetical protein BSZ36_05515 [Rubricoccus marinus]
MIQRIQTLYLLVAGTLLVLFAVFADAWAAPIAANMAWLGTAGLVLAAIAAAIAFIAAVLYKDRKRQRRIIQAAQVVDLLVVAVAVGGLFLREGDAPLATGGILLALAPVLAYVILRLAQRGVDKDIALVRSMDRLR